MAVARSISAIELNCQAGFSVLAFQPDIAQNRALAFRRESFASNLRMQIAEKNQCNPVAAQNESGDHHVLILFLKGKP
ncbi:MAG: hypothetical protein WBJ68_13645 [Candidatus Dechloromonas phosphoritropha]|jgi:hypothetical protein